MIQNLYLIKRTKRPPYHRAPYHPVIICTRRHTAMWEAGSTGKKAWVWSKSDAHRDGEGWLLVRWNGLDIDYGHVVRCFDLPDGTQTGFSHARTAEPWTLIPSAVWWSEHRIPAWLSALGVQLPSDSFSRESIFLDYGTCQLPESTAAKYRIRRRRMLNDGRLLNVTMPQITKLEAINIREDDQ